MQTDPARDHLTALLGRDPFALAAEIEAAAIDAGRARVEANHAERERKVKEAEAIRSARGAVDKITVQEAEATARTSPLYTEHLRRQRELEIAAIEAEAHYYRLRNEQDWLFKAADALRTEAYLAR